MIQVSEYLKTKTIFDSTTLSVYDFFDSDIIDALNNVFGIKYNKMYLIDADDTVIHGIVDDTILLNVAKYTDIYRAMQLDPTEEYSETKTNTGTQTTTDSGTVTNEITPSTITTVTDSKNTADNATMRATDQTQTSSTGSDVNERTDDLTVERTDDLTETRTGYNNVFDNVNKLMSFVNMELYDTILHDIMKSVCYPIYSIDDLAF